MLANSDSRKIVLLGDAKTGKTSLLMRKISGSRPSTQSPTIGCHCQDIIINVNGKDITLQVWDTAGQEMYRALVPVYTRGADAAIILYDITDMASYNSLPNWIDLLKDTIPVSTPIYIVASKLDLIEHAVVKEESARNYAHGVSAHFMSVSSFTGDGVDELFFSIAEELAKRQVSAQGNVHIEPKKSDGCC